jgi:phosphatidylglycerol:prolipoprotein diacylglycerol transferase
MEFIMYPELFRIGGFPIPTYGVLLAVGLLLALFVASRLAARDGLPRERIYDLGLWAIVGGLFGAKILMILTEGLPPRLSLEYLFDFLRSGGVYYGGFLGGFLTVAILTRAYGLNFWKVGDAFAPGVALGQFFGRLGCFAAGDDWGKPTDLPWGVQFTEAAHASVGVPIYKTDGTNLYLHPVQLYESFTMLIVFGVLYYLHRRKKFDGQVLIAYGIIYALVRFALEFFRDDPRGDLFGLTSLTGLSTSQLISLSVAVGALVLLTLRLKKN